MRTVIDTNQLSAFLMQKQVEGIMNMCETTVISSGPAGKAKILSPFCLQALLEFPAIKNFKKLYG